jgi:Ca-activated chloride channel family protein
VTGFRFASPEWLLLLLLLPVLVWRHRVVERRRAASVDFPVATALRQMPATLAARLRPLLLVARLVGLAFMILGLARPQAGHELRQRQADGIDIMLTLDVSSSMELSDLDQGQKTRLQAAKEVVADFVRGRVSDRIGMVVFAAQSFTQCPLTLDYGVLLQFLDGIQIADQSWDGTAIGMAVINAVNRLRESTAKSKVVILLTDGVNNAGEIDPLTAANLAAAVGIKVYTIGVGSDGVIRRPVRGPFGVRYQTVQVEIDEDILRRVADTTGGRYYRATTERKLDEIYQEIGRLETSTITARVSTHYADRYAWFLWPGLVLLLAETALANTRFRRLP